MEVPKRQLKKGVELCFDNINKLTEDAEVLFRRRSHGHSVFLAYSAIEETSKAFMYAMSRIELPKPDELEHVKQHGAKFYMFMALQVSEAIGRAVDKGPQKLDRPLDVKDFEEMERDFEFFSKEVWNLRLRSLYVDYGEGRWVSPFDITRKDAKDWIDRPKSTERKWNPRVETSSAHLITYLSRSQNTRTFYWKTCLMYFRIEFSRAPNRLTRVG